MGQSQARGLAGDESRLLGGFGPQAVIHGGDENWRAPTRRAPAGQEMHERHGIGAAGHGDDDAARAVEGGKEGFKNLVRRTVARGQWSGHAAPRRLADQLHLLRFCSRSEPWRTGAGA
jgi:hypothetical protein